MNVTHNINPILEFEEEFNFIQSDAYYELGVRAVLKIPQYFWFIAASSTSKYHPKSSLGLAGLYRHTKAATKTALCLLDHPIYKEQFPANKKDEIVLALVLHDACKRGSSDIPEEHTRYDHPKLVRERCQPWESGEIASDTIKEMWNNICDLIETHMGIWVNDKEGNAVLAAPSTEAQQFVHLCDYISSRSFIEIDTQNRTPSTNTRGSTGKENDWKNGPASEAQVALMKNLAVKAVQAKLMTDASFDYKGLTKGKASDMIGELKKLLNLT